MIFSVLNSELLQRCSVLVIYFFLIFDDSTLIRFVHHAKRKKSDMTERLCFFVHFIYFILFDLECKFGKSILYNYSFRYLNYYFLIEIHSMQGRTATARHGVTRKRNTKRIKHIRNLFRKNL